MAYPVKWVLKENRDEKNAVHSIIVHADKHLISHPSNNLWYNSF
jgi:cellobiose-specific phosphotransferase system component IIA